MKKLLLTLIAGLPIIMHCYAQSVDRPTVTYSKGGVVKSAEFNTDLKLGIPTDSKEFFQNFLKVKPDNGFTEVPHKQDREGFTHQHFDQYYRGVKVDGAGYNFHYQNGRMYFAHGHYVPIRGMSTTPSITPKEAMLAFASYKEIPASSVDDFTSALIIKEVVTLKGNDTITTPMLTYKVTLISDHKNNDEMGYVDAHTGRVVTTEQRFDSAFTGTFETRYYSTQQAATEFYNNAYNLADFSRGATIHTKNCNNTSNVDNAIEITDANNYWSKAELSPDNRDMGLDVHWALQKIYDHLNTTYQKNSFDNAGFPINACIKYQDGAGDRDNAYWDRVKKVLEYGEGASVFKPIGSIDLIGHEFGHGITYFQTEWSSIGEQRAMNEGLSDIWGAIFEYRIRPNDVWRIGEQVMRSNTCVRNLQDTNDPGAYYQTANTYLTSQYNGGNMYVKGGVFSHWFYLLVNGGIGVNGIGNSYNVSGMGMDRAEDLIIEAVYNNYLDNISTFPELRTAMTNAARTLCSGQNGLLVNLVENAWYAVGVGAQPTIAAITGPTLVCSSGSAFTVNNLPSGCSVLWNASSNLYSQSPTGSPTTYKAVGSGLGQVQATLSSTCASTTLSPFYVTVGSPVPGSIAIEFDAPPRRFTATIDGVVTANTYKWYLDGQLKYTTSSTSVIFQRQLNNCGHVYYVDVAEVNACGVSGISHGEVAEDPCYYGFTISPNPASDNITLTIGSADNASSMGNGSTGTTALASKYISTKAYTIRVLDSFGALKATLNKSGETVTLPVGNLNNGVYVVEITDGKNVYRQQLVVKH
ncbi:MAG: T9SS type A sorting domain-containing protein [Bacteroidales bacterium]|nr:T9SS type A sorting domain-containing protein [Bacteroidales bacterium]